MAIRISCTGFSGMVGSALRKAIVSTGGIELHGADHIDLDIGDVAQVRRWIEKTKPQFLINCAAYREVDKAETNRESAWRANAQGPRVLAELCRELGVKLIHFGTHGVFNGRKIGPYLESDSPDPVNHYATTKIEGERAIAELLPDDQFLILRITWPYTFKANNFFGAILEAARSQDEVRVVADDLANPTPVNLIARKTLDLLKDGQGLFHLSCRGYCSRFELMEALFRKLKLKCRLIPVDASAFPSIAARPSNMALATEKKWMEVIAPMPTWEDALTGFLKDNPI